MIYAIYKCVFQCVQPLQGFAKICGTKNAHVQTMAGSDDAEASN